MRGYVLQTDCEGRCARCEWLEVLSPMFLASLRLDNSEMLSYWRRPMTRATSVAFSTTPLHMYLVITHDKLGNRMKNSIARILLWHCGFRQRQSLLDHAFFPIFRDYFLPYFSWNCMMMQLDLCLLAFCLVHVPVGPNMITTSGVMSCEECPMFSLLHN